MDEKVKIGQKLWQLADSQGYKKVDFAKEISISRQTLDNWIGGSDPSLKDLASASSLLGITFIKLVDGHFEINHTSERKPSEEHETGTKTEGTTDAVPLKDELLENLRDNLRHTKADLNEAMERNKELKRQLSEKEQKIKELENRLVEYQSRKTGT